MEKEKTHSVLTADCIDSGSSCGSSSGSSEIIRAVKDVKVPACVTSCLVDRPSGSIISLRKLSSKNKYHGSLSNLVIH
jgi:hypothetical protein